MARDPAQRTRSARTLSKELREWLDAEEGIARSDKGSRSSRSRKDKERQDKQDKDRVLAPTMPMPLGSNAPDSASSHLVKVLVGALAAGALMLAGGAWWAWQQYSQPPLGAPVDEPVPQVLAP